MNETESDIIFSFLYFVLALCFIFPPKEFAAAGLTIQSLFSSYLGIEDIDFIGYHMKRTTITVFVHSLIPLGYYVGIACLSKNRYMFFPIQLSTLESLFLLLCIASFVLGLTIAFYWTTQNNKNHPVAQSLLEYGCPWRGVAAQINLEFRRLEKFSAVIGGTSIYVTDSWIIKCTTYKIYIAQQTDSHLTVFKSEDFQFSHDTNQAAQYLHINVNSIAPHERRFQLYLNSIEYSDLKDRLSAPIRHARDVVVHQTLNDRFLQAFKKQVEENGRVEISAISNQELENCIGCMACPANIKLVKRCFPLTEGECQQCYCRPMWCLECMGRWFASRQDQHDSTRWMSSLAPCPTCRSKFCMVDVVKI